MPSTHTAAGDLVIANPPATALAIPRHPGPGDRAGATYRHVRG
jgi:hypothetical protein